MALGEGGLVPVTAAKVAFAYAGTDSHQAGMGRSLYETEPVVRMILDRCDEVFRDMRGASLLEVMFLPAESDGALEDPAWQQPAIYAVALRAYRTVVQCGYPTERGTLAGTLVNSRQPGRRGYSAWRKDCGLRHPLDRKDPWKKSRLRLRRST